MKAVLLICSLVSLAWGQMGRDSPCIQKEPNDYRKDPDDCTGFYRCANSVLYRYKCAPGTVFSPDLRMCVHKGGQWDKCKPTDVIMKNQICDGTSDRLIPHTGSCAQYYDCEAPSRYRWQMNLQECPYPRVFNTENRKCEHYSMVDCGDRKLPLGRCEYKAEQCLGAHCRPCYIDNPSCRGKPDGLNPYPYRVGSPFYIVCANQRLIYKGRCTPTGHQYYNEELRSCVPREPETDS